MRAMKRREKSVITRAARTVIERGSKAIYTNIKASEKYTAPHESGNCSDVGHIEHDLGSQKSPDQAEWSPSKSMRPNLPRIRSSPRRRTSGQSAVAIIVQCSTSIQYRTRRDPACSASLSQASRSLTFASCCTGRTLGRTCTILVSGGGPSAHRFACNQWREQRAAQFKLSHGDVSDPRFGPVLPFRASRRDRPRDKKIGWAFWKRGRYDLLDQPEDIPCWA